MTNSQWPMTNSPFPIPNYLFPITYSQLPMTNDPWPMTNDQFPIPHSPFPITYSQLPIPNDQWPMTHDPWPMTNDPWPMTNFLVRLACWIVNPSGMARCIRTLTTPSFGNRMYIQFLPTSLIQSLLAVAKVIDSLRSLPGSLLHF